MRLSLWAGSALALALATVGHAATVTYTATNQASAALTLTGTSLSIVLSNLTPTANTASGVNLLTGLQLIPSISGAGYSLTGGSAAQAFHFDTQTTGHLVNGPITALNWALTSSPNGLYFNGFGTGGMPIIGEAAGGTTYANANSSLTSGPHGDYAYKSATFTITVPQSFSLTAITSANFLFNTDGGTVVPGTPDGGGGAGREVPLPAAAWSGMALMAGMGAWKLRKRVAV